MILEVYDYSWNPSPNNLKKQARICVSVKMKPILMDINTQTGVGPSVSSLDVLGISRSDLDPSDYTTVTLQRGKKLYQLPVLGQAELKIHHARGRTFRCRTGINLERDAKTFSMKTQVVESFPKECDYGIMAGHDFLDENELRLDDKNAQIVSIKTFPLKTVIQYMHPDRKFYLRSHKIFWERHYRPPEKNKVKIALPKSCENCGAIFSQIKKNEKFVGKYNKGEMIYLHGEIDHFPCTLGITVHSYSNNHMIKAVYKKARSKMILSVPECAVRRKEEDESTVIPEKFNNKKKEPLRVPQLAALKTETLDSKVDVSTQTKGDHFFKTKRRTFSKIRSEFSECLYPFTQVENWVNDCPSECSDISLVSTVKKSKDVPEFPNNYADIPKHLLVTIPDRCFRFHHNSKEDKKMDIPDDSIPSRYFSFEQDDVRGNTRVKMNTPDEYEYNWPADEYEYNYPADEYEYDRDADEFKFNCSSEVHNPEMDDYSPAPDVYNGFSAYDYNRVVVLPDRMFRYHDDAKREDFLEHAGGEEELRQSPYKTHRSRYDDDQS